MRKIRAGQLRPRFFQHQTTTRALFLAVCGLYACIHLDRAILGILAESVKSDLQLSDRQLGALTGTAFSLAYGLLGLHFGTLADRLDRIALVRRGAWVWSLSCIAAAFAPHYSVLVACRAGVAVGEALATAAAVSLIAEIAGERYRARAAGAFLTAAFIGAGSASVVGGLITEFARTYAMIPGWRAALAVAGMPGIVGAVYLHHRTDITRRVHPEPVDPGSTRVSSRLVLAAMSAVLVQMVLPVAWSVPLCLCVAAFAGTRWTHHLRRARPLAYRATLGQPDFRFVIAAFSAIMFIDYAAAFWLIPLAQRQFGLSAGTAGARLGGLMIAGGVAGCLLGGWVADLWRAASTSGRVWTAFIAVIIETAAIFAAAGAQQYSIFLFTFGVFCVASGIWTAAGAAIAFDLIPEEHRGTGSAEYFFVTTVLGPGLGPVVVGFGSDLFGSIGIALRGACAVGLLCAALLMSLAIRMRRLQVTRPLNCE